jgi:GNAT superfamily N-acetyltransferase
MTVSHSLKSPETKEEWQAYHDIRRMVLFENRGAFNVYDENHPDEFKKGHYPLVLIVDGQVEGVIRVDIDDARVAIFRRVAIRQELQRRGHGRILLSLAEKFASERGCDSIQSFVDKDAVGFYEKCGFAKQDHRSVSSKSVLMSKRLCK